MDGFTTTPSSESELEVTEPENSEYQMEHSTEDINNNHQHKQR